MTSPQNSPLPSSCSSSRRNNLLIFRRMKTSCSASSSDSVSVDAVDVTTATRCRGAFRTLPTIHDALDSFVGTFTELEECSSKLFDDVHDAQGTSDLAGAMLKLLVSSNSVNEAREAILLTRVAVNLGFGCAMFDWNATTVFKQFLHKFISDSLTMHLLLSVYVRFFRICTGNCTHKLELCQHEGLLFESCNMILDHHKKDKTFCAQILLVRSYVLEVVKGEEDKKLVDEWKNKQDIADFNAAMLIAEEEISKKKQAEKQAAKQPKAQKKKAAEKKKKEVPPAAPPQMTQRTLRLQLVPPPSRVRSSQEEDAEYERMLQERRIELERIQAEKERVEAEKISTMLSRRTYSQDNLAEMYNIEDTVVVSVLESILL